MQRDNRERRAWRLSGLPEEPLHSTTSCRPEDIIYPASDDEQDASERQAKRLRIEAHGLRYLRGEAPLLLTASLRGPFESSSGWQNPWLRKPAHAATKRTSPDNSPVPLKRQKSPRQVAETSKEIDAVQCQPPSPENVQDATIFEFELEPEKRARIQAWVDNSAPEALERDTFWAPSHADGENNDTPVKGMTPDQQWLRNRFIKNKRSNRSRKSTSKTGGLIASQARTDSAKVMHTQRTLLGATTKPLLQVIDKNNLPSAIYPRETGHTNEQPLRIPEVAEHTPSDQAPTEEPSHVPIRDPTPVEMDSVLHSPAENTDQAPPQEAHPDASYPSSPKASPVVDALEASRSNKEVENSAQSHEDCSFHYRVQPSKQQTPSRSVVHPKGLSQVTQTATPESNNFGDIVTVLPRTNPTGKSDVTPAISPKSQERTPTKEIGDADTQTPAEAQPCDISPDVSALPVGADPCSTPQVEEHTDQPPPQDLNLSTKTTEQRETGSPQVEEQMDQPPPQDLNLNTNTTEQRETESPQILALENLTGLSEKDVTQDSILPGPSGTTSEDMDIGDAEESTQVNSTRESVNVEIANQNSGNEAPTTIDSPLVIEDTILVEHEAEANLQACNASSPARTGTTTETSQTNKADNQPDSHGSHTKSSIDAALATPQVDEKEHYASDLSRPVDNDEEGLVIYQDEPETNEEAQLNVQFGLAADVSESSSSQSKVANEGTTLQSPSEEETETTPPAQRLELAVLSPSSLNAKALGTSQPELLQNPWGSVDNEAACQPMQSSSPATGKAATPEPIEFRPSTPPDVGVSIKSFATFNTPSSIRRSRQGRFSSFSNSSRRSTQHGFDTVNTSPGGTTRSRIRKRVSFAPLPGEVDAERDIEQAGSTVTRPASPPPQVNLETATDDVDDRTHFRNHFQAAGHRRGILSKRSPLFSKTSSRLQPRLLPSESQQKPESPLADAMAEAFIAADERQKPVEEDVTMTDVSAMTDNEPRPDVQSPWQKDSQVEEDDDVAAVLGNLEEFLGAWNVEAEVEKTRIDTPREVLPKRTMATTMSVTNEVNAYSSVWDDIV